MPVSGSRQAFPEKVIQPKRRHEKKTAPLYATGVYRNETRPQHLGEHPANLQYDHHVWRQPYDDNRIEGHPTINITLLPWLIVAKAWGNALKDTGW